MRLLVVGLGSMGKRRVRNLLHLGVDVVAGFDPRADRRDETKERFGIETFADFDKALEVVRPDALIVSTPPDLHVQYALRAVEAGKHVFTEASVVDDRMSELLAASHARPDLVVAPSATLRYHPSVQEIKRIVDEESFGAPLLLTYQSGQWLPDWHPWEDYRTFYVSRRETGACREIVPFELSWLTWVLGPVEAVWGTKRKLSPLEADIDDVYALGLRFGAGTVGHLMVDVIARAPVRAFRLCSASATIEWDGTARTMRVYRASTGAWESVPEPASVTEPGYVYSEHMYIEEMRDFLAACAGERPWGYSVEDDMATLRILEAAERSSDQGMEVALP